MPFSISKSSLGLLLQDIAAPRIDTAQATSLVASGDGLVQSVEECLGRGSDFGRKRASPLFLPPLQRHHHASNN